MGSGLSDDCSATSVEQAESESISSVIAAALLVDLIYNPSDINVYVNSPISTHPRRYGFISQIFLHTLLEQVCTYNWYMSSICAI